MGTNMTVEVEGDHLVVAAVPEEPRRPHRGRWWKVLIGIGVVLVLLVGGAALWFLIGREDAKQVTDQQAIEALGANGATGTDAAGRPAVGVYTATADGTESIGVPGLDEGLGPNAPVTVTHGDGGCFTYRVDFNSHHWRNWNFCPTADATFAVTGLQSWTYRKAPGIDVDSLLTYVCEEPIAFLWSGAAAGDQRSGSCTGTASDSDGVTADASSIEVLDRGTMTVGDETIEVVHLRSSDVLTDAQTGTEVDEWWLDAETGLPVKLSIDARISVSGSDYRETGVLTLSTLVPAT